MHTYFIPVYVNHNWQKIYFQAPDPGTCYAMACSQYGKENVSNGPCRV